MVEFAQPGRQSNDVKMRIHGVVVGDEKIVPPIDFRHLGHRGSVRKRPSIAEPKQLIVARFGQRPERRPMIVAAAPDQKGMPFKNLQRLSRRNRRVCCMGLLIARTGESTIASFRDRR